MVLIFLNGLIVKLTIILLSSNKISLRQEIYSKTGIIERKSFMLPKK